MTKYGVIYKITNKVNNKVYIGQTTRKGGFDERYGYNFFKNIHNKHLKRSVEKYGESNFEIDKEFYIAYSKEELNNKEKYYIDLFKSNDYNYGYNIKAGGDNVGTILGKNRAEILLRQGKPIFCKNTCEIFLSFTDVEFKYNIPSQTIRRICNGESYREKMSFNKDLNTYLDFEYYKHKNKKPIVCLTTNEKYKSFSKFCKKYNLKSNHDKFKTKTYFKNGFISVKSNNDKEFKVLYLYDYVINNYEIMFNNMKYMGDKINYINI